MALELGQVEVRPGPAVELLAGVVEEREPEVEQRGRDGLAVDEHVALGQVPAARAHDERRDLVVQAVALAVLVELDRPADGVVQVALPVDDVRPGGRVGVLEVGHEDARARVERVDHHLAVDRAGDLDAAVAAGRRGGGATRQSPSRTSRVSGRKSGRAPASSSRCALAPALEQLARGAGRARAGAARRTRALPGLRISASAGATTSAAVVTPSRAVSNCVLFRGALERQRRALASRDRLHHRVEVSRADLALVAGGGVALAPRARTRAPAARRRRACPRPRSPGPARTWRR